MSNEQISLFDIPSAEPTEPQAPVPANFDPELIPTSARIPIPEGTYESMEQMREHCNRCHRCDLGANRTNAVIGRGSLTAPIMVVGEGPGQTEDETGLPFTGKSGQLLEKILASVNLSTETDVFICNVVKCRPPENRTPTTDEAEACKGYLLEQIQLIDP
jgi:uracil-DNA glycosylase